MNSISELEPQFGRLVLHSISPFISSYGRKFHLGAISMKNIGLMLTTKTNKTEPYWKNQQPQTALARPGSVLAPQGPAEHPVLVPAGARRRGPALGTRGAPRGFCAGPVCAVGTAGPVLQTAGDSGASSASDAGCARTLRAQRPLRRCPGPRWVESCPAPRPVNVTLFEMQSS